MEERDKLELKLQKRQNVVLELQGQLSALQCELDELKGEYEKVVENFSKKVGDLRYKYEEETNKLKLDFGKEKMILVNENEFETSRRIEIEAKVKDIDEQNNFLRKELEDVQNLSKDVNIKIFICLNNNRKIFLTSYFLFSFRLIIVYVRRIKN